MDGSRKTKIIVNINSEQIAFINIDGRKRRFAIANKDWSPMTTIYWKLANDIRSHSVDPTRISPGLRQIQLIVDSLRYVPGQGCMLRQELLAEIPMVITTMCGSPSRYQRLMQDFATEHQQYENSCSPQSNCESSRSFWHQKLDVTIFELDSCFFTVRHFTMISHDQN